MSDLEAQTVKDRCMEVVSSVFAVNRGDLSAATSPDTLPEWDSLAHVQLITALEEQFAVEIPPEDSINFESLQAIMDWLSEKV